MAIKSVHVTSSGAITSTGVPCKVLAVRGLGGAGAGTVTLKDGGTSGTTKHIEDSPNGGAFGGPIPGGGLEFVKDCYATLGGTAAPAGCTVIIEDYT